MVQSLYSRTLWVKEGAADVPVREWIGEWNVLHLPIEGLFCQVAVCREEADIEQVGEQVLQRDAVGRRAPATVRGIVRRDQLAL